MYGITIGEEIGRQCIHSSQHENTSLPDAYTGGDAITLSQVLLVSSADTCLVQYTLRTTQRPSAVQSAHANDGVLRARTYRTYVVDLNMPPKIVYVCLKGKRWTDACAQTNRLLRFSRVQAWTDPCLRNIRRARMGQNVFQGTIQIQNPSEALTVRI